MRTHQQAPESGATAPASRDDSHTTYRRVDVEGLQISLPRGRGGRRAPRPPPARVSDLVPHVP